MLCASGPTSSFTTDQMSVEVKSGLSQNDRVVIGDRGLKEGKVEYKGRRDAEASMLPLADVLSFLKEKGCGARVD